MAENQELKGIIRAVLEEIFGDARIGDVYVASAYDKDGDEILRVKVVFDGTEEQFDARKASSVVRRLPVWCATCVPASQRSASKPSRSSLMYPVMRWAG